MNRYNQRVLEIEETMFNTSILNEGIRRLNQAHSNLECIDNESEIITKAKETILKLIKDLEAYSEENKPVFEDDEDDED